MSLPAMHQQQPQHEYCRLWKGGLVSPLDEPHAAALVAQLTESKAAESAASRCLAFRRNFNDPFPFWTPWQPPVHRCPGVSRACNPSPTNGTIAAMNHIFRHQHPAQCDRANFLVVSKEWPSGLGSTIHVKSQMFLLALQMNRVLIDHPNSSWEYTNPRTCPQRSWSCYFAALTNCSLPDRWERLSTKHRPFGLNTATYLVIDPAPRTWHSSPWQIAPSYNGSPSQDWLLHLTVYLIRPNARTLRAACVAWACITGGVEQPPRPMASVFIRSGDKGKEAALRQPKEYFSLLKQRNESLRVASVYVGTDDATLLESVVQDYSADWTLLWLPHLREYGGLTMQEVERRYDTAMAEWQVLASLADLYVAAAADVFVGTLSSNWCRLVNELRNVQGKTHIPFLAVDEKNDPYPNK